MSSATVRVVCSECGSKLDIRAELAGSKRRCPKCKTEFTVPAVEDADDGVSLAEESETVAETKSKTPVPTSPAKAAPPAVSKPLTLPVGDDDDDDEDYIPSFVTSSAKNEQKTPLPPTPAKPVADEDPEPVLSIPKIPPPTKLKLPSFDADDLEDEDDEPPRRPASAKSRRESPSRRERDSDPFDLDEPSPPPKSRAPSRSPGLSDSSVPTTTATRDRAAAARELRQALKDSSLREPQEQQSRGGFSFDFSGLWSEIGLKGVAIVLGTILLFPGIMWVGSSMIGVGVKLPPLGYVTGKVTYDGQPAVNAVVRFMPIPEPGQESDSAKFRKIRTSFGVTNEKGEYKLMYMENVQGVAVGQCRVWLEVPPPMIVPGEFSPAGATTREVKPGSQTYDFSLAAPPPRKR